MERTDIEHKYLDEVLAFKDALAAYRKVEISEIQDRLKNHFTRENLRTLNDFVSRSLLEVHNFLPAKIKCDAIFSYLLAAGQLSRKGQAMGDVLIVSAARIPIGNFGGSLQNIPVAQLGAVVLKATLEKVWLRPVADDRQKQFVPDTLRDQGLVESFYGYHMGVTAENIAARYGISRPAQDEMGAMSHRRARAAISKGWFKDGITPVVVPQRKGRGIVFDTDERPMETSVERIARLPTAFKKDGTVTAGNAAGVNDGAAAMLLMS